MLKKKTVKNTKYMIFFKCIYGAVTIKSSLFNNEDISADASSVKSWHLLHTSRDMMKLWGHRFEWSSRRTAVHYSTWETFSCTPALKTTQLPTSLTGENPFEHVSQPFSLFVNISRLAKWLCYKDKIIRLQTHHTNYISAVLEVNRQSKIYT